MTNHPNRSKPTITLRALVAETYTADEAKFFGFADRGNGSAFGDQGQLLAYDANADSAYGDIEMVACAPIASEDGRTEFVFKSRWIDGANGYQFRVTF